MLLTAPVSVTKRLSGSPPAAGHTSTVLCPKSVMSVWIAAATLAPSGLNATDLTRPAGPFSVVAVRLVELSSDTVPSSWPTATVFPSGETAALVVLTPAITVVPWESPLSLTGQLVTLFFPTTINWSPAGLNTMSLIVPDTACQLSLSCRAVSRSQRVTAPSEPEAASQRPSGL